MKTGGHVYAQLSPNPMPTHNLKWPVLVLSAFIFICYGLPFVALTAMAADLIDMPEQFGDILQTHRLLCLWASVRRALLVSAISVVVALVLAVVLNKVSFRWRFLCLLLFTLPFLASDVGRAFALRVFLGRQGSVNQVLMHLGVISEPLDWLLFSEFAVGAGQFVNVFPFTLFILTLAVQDINPRLHQVAQELRVEGFYLFRKLTLPLCLNAIVGSFMIAFALGLGAMVEDSFLSSAPCSISQTIISLWQTSRFELAAATSLLVWLVSLSLLLCTLVVVRRSPNWFRR